MSIVALSLCIASGCDRARQTDTSLPENPAILDTSVVSPGRLLECADRDFEHLRAEFLRVSPATIAGMAEAEIALRALRRGKPAGVLAPVTIIATVGSDYGGMPYVNVTGLISSREMNGVRFAFADRAGNTRSITVDIPRDCKGLHYVDSIYCRREVQGWDEFQRNLAEDVFISLEPDARFVTIPWPEDDQIACAAAIRDNPHGIGNYVLVTPFDAPSDDAGKESNASQPSMLEIRDQDD